MRGVTQKGGGKEGKARVNGKRKTTCSQGQEEIASKLGKTAWKAEMGQGKKRRGEAERKKGGGGNGEEEFGKKTFGGSARELAGTKEKGISVNAGGGGEMGGWIRQVHGGGGKGDTGAKRSMAGGVRTGAREGWVTGI